METNLKSASQFLDWCNTPIYRANGELGFRNRVIAMFPEYNTYIIIDETGKSIFPKDKFLTSIEVYEYWLKSIEKDKDNQIVEQAEMSDFTFKHFSGIPQF
jgi:hypothetical protein